MGVVMLDSPLEDIASLLAQPFVLLLFLYNTGGNLLYSRIARFE